MQINLPDNYASLIEQKAAAAGYAGRIDAYVAHLVVSDDYEDHGSPTDQTLAGKGREAIDAMISAGVESGPSTPMTAEDWLRLHEQIEARGE